ncbi:MAG: type II toxin-antitoxin system VapC family toxin [Planctomycetes bacterium]|nr:type II toxin-antitoxin system VapC family toxin [Planctomycetota bacterium]
MKSLFVDTSAWFAFINKRDAGHRAVKDALVSFSGRVVTSNYIFDEIVTLTNARSGHVSAMRVGIFLMESKSVDLVRVTAEDEREAWSLFKARADKNYSFTDCTSFVLLRRLAIDDCLALDEDFEREGFHTRPD